MTLMKIKTIEDKTLNEFLLIFQQSIYHNLGDKYYEN